MMEIRRTRERSDDLVSKVLSRKFYAKMLLFHSKRHNRKGDTLICQDDENPDIEAAALDIADYVQLLHYMALMMICTN